MKYGIFGYLQIFEGKGSDFISVLIDGTKNMPGCIRYDISYDQNDSDKIWIYELWESKEYHKNSLMLPSVQKAIKDGREMIKEFGSRTEFVPFN